MVLPPGPPHPHAAASTAAAGAVDGATVSPLGACTATTTAGGSAGAQMLLMVPLMLLLVLPHTTALSALSRAAARPNLLSRCCPLSAFAWGLQMCRCVWGLRERLVGAARRGGTLPEMSTTATHCSTTRGVVCTPVPWPDAVPSAAQHPIFTAALPLLFGLLPVLLLWWRLQAGGSTAPAGPAGGAAWLGPSEAGVLSMLPLTLRADPRDWAWSLEGDDPVRWWCSNGS